MAVRLFKYGSLVLAILGLVVLFLVAGRIEVPAVEIGALAGTMNWAYVRIEGVMSRQPAYEAEERALKLWVQDGTGEIMAVAYRSEADSLLAGDSLPVMGDRVALEGTLRVKEDFHYLVLDGPQQVEVQPVEAGDLEIAAIDEGAIYQKVTIRGLIRDEWTPYEGLRILTLRDATGEIDLTLALSSPVAGGSEWPDLGVGQAVQATGAVDRYQDRLQVSVGRGSDLVALDEGITLAPLRRSGEIAAGDVGQMVAIEGEIVGVRPFPSGVRYTLDDGSGPVVLLLWQDRYEALPEPGALAPGARVRVLGEVAAYQGELEILPELPSDVTLLAAGELAVPERQLGELSVADVDQRVRVQGVLKTLQTFPAGVRGTLDDGTGTVTLLLWQEVYDGLAEPAWVVPGAVLRIEGELAEYQGELEIVPSAAAGVAVAGYIEWPVEEPSSGQAPAAEAGPTVQATAVPTATSAVVKAASEAVPTPEPTVESMVGATTRPASSPTLPPTPAIEQRALGAITAGDVGRRFTVARAGIAEVDYFSAGVKYTLTDGTGSITLLVWQNVMEEIAGRHDLFPGSQVQVTGSIDEYQGDLEIAPQDAAGVTVIDRGERLEIEPRKIDRITASDEGRVFSVEGVVARVEGARWLHLWLGDGTGEILIYVPERVVGYLPAGINPGVPLRVTGEVDIYQGVLELIPLAGADVEVR